MPIFSAWWQELKVYFKSACISGPGNQVLQSFCEVCSAITGGKNFLSKASISFCRLNWFFFFPLLEVYGIFFSNKASLWVVMCSYFNLCFCLGLTTKFCGNMIRTFLFLNHIIIMQSMNDIFKRRWCYVSFFFIPAFVCMCTHAWQDAAALARPALCHCNSPK